MPMIELAGQAFDGVSSRPVPSTLQVDDAGMVRCSAWPDRLPLALAELEITERIGNVPRIVRFPDGAQFETGDNDALDAALARHRQARGSRLMHRLESRLRYAAVAVALVLLATVGFLRWGLPWLAEVAAFSVSAQTAASLDQGALEALDKSFFAPSHLDAATQSRLRARFEGMAAEAEPGFAYRLHFRAGRHIGANALALPSGSIIVTDELVRLARHDDELVAVLAHELGHVVHRHALRRVFQSSAVALIGTLLTGDVSGPATVVVAVPTVLVEMQYSQDFERDADAYALEWLRRHRIDPAHFKHIMLRLEKVSGSSELPSFFSTHPATTERVKLFERLDGSPEPAVE